MNVFDDMPDVPKCPHCGHDGEGLQWAFPDPFGLASAQCACLACGAHGPVELTYEEAVEAWLDGFREQAA